MTHSSILAQPCGSLARTFISMGAPYVFVHSAACDRPWDRHDRALSCSRSGAKRSRLIRAAAQEGLIGISIRFGTPDAMAASRVGAISAARSILWAGTPMDAASAIKSTAGSMMSMAMKRLARADA